MNRNETRPADRPERRRAPMEWLWIVGFVAVWLLLQLVILPRAGVST